MRRTLGMLGIVLGAFALLLGILAQPVIYDSLAKVPLDQETTSVSRGENMSALRVSGDGIEKLEGVALVSTRTVVGIPGLVEDEDNSAFWQTTVESAVEGGPVLTYSEEGISFDRTTALANNCCGDYVAVGDVEAPDEDAVRQAMQHDGLLLKFPFDTQQEDYPYWDGALGRSVTAEFQGEEKVEGVAAYKFVMVLGPEEVSESQGLPGALFGTDEPVDAARIYENTRTLWVEPNTGVILRGVEEQNVRFEPRDSALPSVPITIGTIGYSDETVASNVDTYGSRGALLGFINGPLTWVGIVVGVALLALGAFLALGGRREDGRAGAHADDPDDVDGYDPYDDQGTGEDGSEAITRRLYRERDPR